MKYIIISVLVAMIAISCNKPLFVGKKHQLVWGNSGHKCPYGKVCPMLRDMRFKGCRLCVKGDSCYIMDKLHWKYPRMDYDQLDSVLTNTKR